MTGLPEAKSRLQKAACSSVSILYFFKVSPTSLTEPAKARAALDQIERIPAANLSQPSHDYFPVLR